MRNEAFRMKTTAIDRKGRQTLFHHSVCLLFASLYNAFFKQNNIKGG